MSIEHESSVSKGPGDGLGEWVRALHMAGLTAVARSVNMRVGGSKEEILSKLEFAGLPIEPYVQSSTSDFLADPDKFFAQLPPFKTFFTLFEPGIERLVGASREGVIPYVEQIAREKPNYPGFYLSGHDYVFSGNITVSEIGSVTARYVLGQYNELSTGRRQPDLTITMDPLRQPEYEFTGVMSGSDWQNSVEPYLAESGAELTKPEMAKIAKDAIFMLPRDGSTILPGWYELKVLEHADKNGDMTMHPYFIKAIY